jgi:hypothetical protein
VQVTILLYTYTDCRLYVGFLYFYEWVLANALYYACYVLLYGLHIYGRDTKWATARANALMFCHVSYALYCCCLHQAVAYRHALSLRCCTMLVRNTNNRESHITLALSVTPLHVKLSMDMCAGMRERPPNDEFIW